jgi:hypothetical protein
MLQKLGGVLSMRFSLPCIAVFAAVVAVAHSVGADQSETPHLAFVTEYIRELGATEDVRAAAEKELAQAHDDNERLSDAVHGSTLIQLELQSQIGMLKSMKLNAPYEQLIPNIAAFYGDKVAVHQQLVDLTSTFLAGPKPGVDFGALAAEMPKLRARLDYLDKALFEASPLVFATLIDPKPDSKNHVSHLIVTRAERTKLIANVNKAFGEKLTQKNPNYTVSAAYILKVYFQKDFKCSDEPWQ